MLRVPAKNGVALSPWPSIFDAYWEMARWPGSRWFTDLTRGMASARIPVMDVEETATEYRCVLELPGVAPEEVNVTVQGNTLTVAGEKRFGDGSAQSGHVRFYRAMKLPRTVDVANIRARHEHGVLTLVLPKAESDQPRQIPVEVGAAENGPERGGSQ